MDKPLRPHSFVDHWRDSMSLLVDVYKIIDEYHQGGGYLLLAIGNITQTSLIVTLILIVIYAFR